MNVELTKSKPATTPQQLQQVEHIISHTLPQQYKAFLLQHNGGRPKPAVFDIQWTDGQPAKHWDSGEVDYFLSVYDGEYSNFLTYYTTYSGRIPDDTVSIAYDAGGNQILLGVGEQNYGKVFFWMHSYETDEEEETDYSNVGFVANSFNEFLDSLYEGE